MSQQAQVHVAPEAWGAWRVDAVAPVLKSARDPARSGGSRRRRCNVRTVARS
jgi:hypothetical protein